MVSLEEIKGPLFFVTFCFSLAYGFMVGEILPQDFVQGVLKTPSITGLLVAGAYGVIGAPILEELLFRGFIQPPMVARFGLTGGIVLTSVVFGLAHVAAPWAVVPTAVVGGVAGWLRYRTGNLGTSIVFHAVYNLLVFIIKAIVI